MVDHAPRDMAEWMKSIERRAAAAARAASSIPLSYNNKLRDDILADKVRHPAAPVEITHETGLYRPDGLGREFARLQVEFPDVTKATDGTDIAIREYELWGRDDTTNYLEASTGAVAGLAAPGVTVPSLAATPAMKAKAAKAVGPFKRLAVSPVSSLRADGLVPGAVWTFKVRAIGQYTTAPGEWSVELQTQLDEDTTPPPQPTVPRLTVSRGTIRVEWDGQAVTGAMPGDFSYLIVSYGEHSSPINEVTRFYRGGGITVISGTDYYTPQFVRFQAVDLAGNRSPWSEQAAGFTVPMVDADVILSEIDAAKVWLRNIDARTSILDGTIVTEHLVVTEKMTAALAQFLKVRADMIEANAVQADALAAGSVTAAKLEAKLALVSTIIAGPELGTHAQMDERGFRVFAEDTTDGIPNEVVRMGVAETDDYFSITRADGSVAAAISADGVGSFSSASAEETFYYKGQELREYLGEFPYGVDTSALMSGSANLIGANWMRVVGVKFVAQPGRNYKAVFQGLQAWSSVAGDRINVKMTYLSNNTPTAATIPTDSCIMYVPIASNALTTPPLQAMGTFNPGTEPSEVTVIIWIRRETGTGTVSYNTFYNDPDHQKAARLWIEDMGPDVPETGTYFLESGTVPPASPPASLVTRTAEWGHTSVKSFDGSNNHYNYSPSKGYQGLSPAGYGNTKSLWTFPSLTSTLSGATIHDIWVYFYFEHWYYNAGGTARIVYHGNSLQPATYGSLGLAVTSGSWPKAAGRWVRVPSSLYAGFKAGTYKGFGLEGDGTYGTYGIASSSRIRIKYTK